MTKTTYFCVVGDKKRQNGRYAIRTNLAHQHARFPLSTCSLHLAVRPYGKKGTRALLARQNCANNTRNSNLFYIPYCRTNLRKLLIWFQGPTLFNSLSREIQNSESISLFGKRLRKFLLSKLN